ncbi:hypothetical protein B0I35DRAFT_417055 [Stachybotrys elegans]|uniref:DUF202 domain-containing protein n=1 Tax=Stachybotrys elegans TaxID=80388 RepID=A0A8K0T6I1_9HYPO|nr:hypothetical protein B0I35DRAFT_417055 [Stachybotrys elegans]
MASTAIDDESLAIKPRSAFASLTQPVEIQNLEIGHSRRVFFEAPFLGPLLFENESSDARDHCANERTFLSYLRLSVYMAVMSVATTLSFHLKHKATDIERRIAYPLGLVFWVLAAAVLFAGLLNYMNTVNKYGRKVAIVQTGRRTHVILGATAACIVATSVILLVITHARRKAAE